MTLSARCFGCALTICLALHAGCSSQHSSNEPHCAPMDGFPDPGDIALTPRADAEIEMLALRCSEGLVADQEIYDQLAVDLAAIRAADPAMADIRGRTAFLSDDLLWESEDVATAERLLRGDEPQYQCLVDALAATSEPWEPPSREGGAQVSFEGLFDFEGLALVFEAVPGIVTAESNYLAEDGNRIAYDVSSNPRRYLFDRAGGDCPAGCTTHHYYLWEIPEGGAPELVAEWGNTDEADFGTAPEGFSPGDLECGR